MESTLPRPQKLALFLYGAKSKSLNHCLRALTKIEKLSPKSFMPLLIQILNRLPRTITQPSEAYPAEFCARMVMGTDDLRAWHAFRQAADRVDVDVRLVFLASMDNLPCSSRQRRARLAFLATFLDDVTVRDVEANPKKHKEAWVAEEFPRLEVRNFAALTMASILKMPAKPKPKWTAAQWAGLRANVKKAIDRPANRPQSRPTPALDPLIRRFAPRLAACYSPEPPPNQH
jgi:hypothetical protein